MGWFDFVERGACGGDKGRVTCGFIGRLIKGSRLVQGEGERGANGIARKVDVVVAGVNITVGEDARRACRGVTRRAQPPGAVTCL